MTWSAALSWAKDDMEPSPSSPIASGAVPMNPVMQSKNAHYGRPASGALAPSTLMMSAPPPTIPVAPIAASSTLDTPTSEATALPPRLVYSVMSWGWHTLTLSGITLTLVMKGLMFSCMVATL